MRFYSTMFGGKREVGRGCILCGVLQQNVPKNIYILDKSGLVSVPFIVSLISVYSYTDKPRMLGYSATILSLNTNFPSMPLIKSALDIQYNVNDVMHVQSLCECSFIIHAMQ